MMNNRIKELEEQNKQLRKLVSELTAVTDYVINRKPSEYFSKRTIGQRISSAFDGVRNHATLIVFLKGIALFIYAVSEIV
tara:strand:+ start:584 stop:823 length:240 start_codon:yes stop_codon:yes gene_type:complete